MRSFTKEYLDNYQQEIFCQNNKIMIEKIKKFLSPIESGRNKGMTFIDHLKGIDFWVIQLVCLVFLIILNVSQLIDLIKGTTPVNELIFTWWVFGGIVLKGSQVGMIASLYHWNLLKKMQ